MGTARSPVIGSKHHEACTGHFRHAYKSNGWACTSADYPESRMSAWLDELTATVAARRARFAALVPDGTHARMLAECEQYDAETLSGHLSGRGSAMATYNTWTAPNPRQVPASQCQLTTGPRVTITPREDPSCSLPSPSNTSATLERPPEPRVNRSSYTPPSPRMSTSSSRPKGTSSAIVSTPLRSGGTRSAGRPACERCGQTFRTVTGAQWHAQHRPTCAKSRAA